MLGKRPHEGESCETTPKRSTHSRDMGECSGMHVETPIRPPVLEGTPQSEAMVSNI
jgi:hypothetical protein